MQAQDIQTWPILIGTLIGSIIGSGFGSWLTGLYGEKGRIAAISARLEKVTLQTATLTKTAEEIKTQLSYKQWHRQTVWNEKRDMYRRYLTALIELQSAIGTFKAIISVFGTSQDVLMDQKKHSALTKMNTKIEELSHAFALARLFGPPELIRVGAKWTQATHDNPIQESAQWCADQAQRNVTLELLITEIAKKDILGDASAEVGTT